MGKYNESLEANRSQDYLGHGKHEVTIQSAELSFGKDARPAWADKSVKFMFANDEGVAFWDCELSPLQKQNGEENDMAVTIGMGNIENMGHEWGEVNSADDYAKETEAFVMSGSPLGAKVLINIVEKDSDDINPNTNKPYVRRNVYVNKLIEAGAGGTVSIAETDAVPF